MYVTGLSELAVRSWISLIHCKAAAMMHNGTGHDGGHIGGRNKNGLFPHYNIAVSIGTAEVPCIFQQNFYCLEQLYF